MPLQRPYCDPAHQRGGSDLGKPPVFGYNYESVTLTEATVANPGVAYPLAVTRPTSGIFNPPIPVSIVGLWLASSIENPSGVDAGVFVGKIQGSQIDLSGAPKLYFQHVSRSINTISRTGGLSFGEYAGLNLGGSEAFGVYLSGSDAGIRITYALTITYITNFTFAG